MDPRKPMQPMDFGPAWWPDGIGQPASSGGQGDLHYAFLTGHRRLAIQRDGEVAFYDSGEHRIGGVSQSGRGQTPAFTGQNGPVRLDELKELD